MRIPGSGRARRLRDRVYWKLGKAAVILTYHRVAEPEWDPWELCVSPNNFADQLDMLSRLGTVLRVADAVRLMNEGRLPPGAICVTFDDGYADNLHAARPILEKHGLPATVFIASGGLGSDREFWSDELEKVLLATPRLPEELSIRLGDEVRAWTIPEAERSGDDPGVRGWRVGKGLPGRRQAIYTTLYPVLKSATAARRRQVMDELATWSGIDRQVRDTHRMMTPDEVLDLAADELVEVGAHTVTHPLLSTLDPVEQRREIEGSRIALEELLGGPVTSFAYPFGGYGPATPRIVRESGFAVAGSTRDALATRRDDPFRVPRITVGNWDGERLAAELAHRGARTPRRATGR